MTLLLRRLRTPASTPNRRTDAGRTRAQVLTGPALAVAAALAVLVGTAACSSDSGGSSGGSTESAGKPTSGAKDVDICGLLTADEITQVIGENPGGKAESFLGDQVCEWVNEETQESITLSISAPGSAPGGKLEEDDEVESEPGPDGIRFTPLQSAVFAVGERAGDIQVVVDEDKDPDRAVTIRLITLVRDRA